MALAAGIFLRDACCDAVFAARRDAFLAGVLFSDGAWMLSGRVLCFLVTPGASLAYGARGYDCGPEPSLRTSPSSSSSRPSAFPSDSLGRIYTPRAPQAAATPGSGGFSVAGVGADWVL